MNCSNYCSDSHRWCSSQDWDSSTHQFKSHSESVCTCWWAYLWHDSSMRTLHLHLVSPSAPEWVVSSGSLWLSPQSSNGPWPASSSPMPPASSLCYLSNPLTKPVTTSLLPSLWAPWSSWKSLTQYWWAHSSIWQHPSRQHHRSWLCLHWCSLSHLSWPCLRTSWTLGSTLIRLT